MQITNVKLRQSHDEGNSKLKATASVVLDGEFVINEIKVIDGVSGLFIAMPSRKDSYGNYFDIVHPLNQNVRDKLTIAVLEVYNNRMSVQRL
jgi:stage V sporulation protein G